MKVDGPVREAVLQDVYALLAEFDPADPDVPPLVFGAVVDRRHKEFATAEKTAYKHVLHRFDEMLKRTPKSGPGRQNGLVVHDRRDIPNSSQQPERDIQTWTALWQRSGQGLDRVTQVPLFVDSHASRLIQAADLVSYALWRHYGQDTPDTAYSDGLWPKVDVGPRGDMSGVIHLTPAFGTCPCPPCQSRRKT